ncbi:MAG: hypothetical protein WAK93_18010 [Solirubrobacteraceae bacterium]
MRMIFEVQFPNEPFNSMVKAGTAGQKLQEIMGEVQPEAAYFTEQDGSRGALLVLDVADASRIPALSEPFFLAFDASVKVRICMTAEDLGAAGLDELGQRYG